jgi:two-component system sensor histidine kinase ChvG
VSIRWKIALLCLIIVFVPIYLLNRYAIRFFDRYTRRALEEQMIDYAYIVAQEYRSACRHAQTPAQRTAFQQRLAVYSQEFQTRLRVLSTEGVVLFDSHPDSSVGMNMSDRPEVYEALQGRYGARCRLTADREYMYYYSALPVASNGRVAGVVLASRHTGPIIQAIKRMMRHHRVAMLLSLILAGAIALLLSQTLTYRLRKLTRAASAFTRGDQPLDVDIRGHDEIAELSAAFTGMAQEIKQKNNYTRQFLSALVHELKTPVTAIKGAAEVLEDSAAEKTEARHRFLGNIRHECDRMIRMINELRVLNELDAEEIRGSKQQVDYVVFLREVIERLRPAYSPPHAAVSYAPQAESLPVALVPERIEQVITNILDNAMRFTPADGRITVQVRRHADTVQTCIEDTGPGIPEADRKQVFERFFTTDRSNPEEGRGSGLGLAIVRSIIRNHGGTVRAGAGAQGGALICFTLPC